MRCSLGAAVACVICRVLIYRCLEWPAVHLLERGGFFAASES